MTVSLLTLKGDFWRHQGLQWKGTATGGAATFLTDPELKNRKTDDFPFATENRQIRITSGDADGDLRLITDLERTEGKVYPNRDFSAAIANENTYEIWGADIYGGTQLTDLFNDVLRRIKLRTYSRLNVSLHKRVYDISSLADSVGDVVTVWERRPNFNVGGDYRAAEVIGWRAFRTDGATTPKVMLNFVAAHPLVLPTTTLDGALNDSATTINVVATEDTPSPDIDFPTAGRLVIDSELIDYTGVTATSFTGCTRGVGDSEAASHLSGADVDQTSGTYYYVDHYTGQTALSTDASTIDSVYRDWIVWETIYEYARMRTDAPSGDRSAWQRRVDRAARELSSLRPRFITLDPTTIRAVDF